MTFLETPHLLLRPLAESDAAGPYPTWLNDAETCAGNSHHVFPYSREEAKRYIANTHGSQTDLILAITLRDSGEHIGNVALQRIHMLNRSAELALLLGDATVRGKGYGTEACSTLVDHGFRSLNLRRITFGTFASNAAMLALGRRLGFTQEGTLKQSVFKEGVYHDVLLFAKHAQEGAAK
jgi:ribosomal-protein-alanine N-acetyltransferase